MKKRLAILLSLSIISTTMTTPYITVAEEFTDEVISEELPVEEAAFEDVFTDENVGAFEEDQGDNVQENPEAFVVVDQEMQAAEAKIHGLVYNAAAVQTGQHQLNITEADGWAAVKFTPDVSGRYSLALGDPSRARMYIAEGINNAISSWENDDCHDGEKVDFQ